MEKKLTYALNVGVSAIDPDDNKLDFDTPANDKSDFNQGYTIGGRVNFHPLGHLKFSQGDFKRETKVTIGIAAFTWSNDDDNNTYTDTDSKHDVDSVTGLEISGAFRSAGFSIDAQYNILNSELIDQDITNGLYRNSKTKLTNFAIEGGYMFGKKFEIVAGYEIQDADNYADTWTRTSFGANYFFHEHDFKTQVTYRIGENLDGKTDNNEDELFIQLQYVF